MPPTPKMVSRIDYFAMAAMEAFIGRANADILLSRVEKETGETREVIIAKWAYAVADAMEIEAGNH